MPDILRGYTFSRSAARFRDTATGKFVGRQRIQDLLEQNVAGADGRLSAIVQDVANGRIEAGYAQTLMRDELRRVSLQNAALGKGGLDQLDFADYGRVGNQLRDTYQRMTNMLDGVERGTVSLPQALRRVEGYTLEARNQFFAAQRAATVASGRQFEERRVLHAQESCPDCIEYAGLGWQPMDSLPMIGEQSQCQKYCRCTLESREVINQPQGQFA